MKHRLARMFEANSIAIVGASPKEHSFGLRMVQSAGSAGFEGDMHFINPKYDSMLGKNCYASLKQLGKSVDLALLGVGGAHIESALVDAIESGAGSAVIYDACHGVSGEKNLLQRLKDIAKEANFPICGGNCMGFINVPSRCVGTYYPAGHLEQGGITLLAHSGSVFTLLALNDARYRFDLVVSPGQEIGSSIDEYIDYALSRETTNVIAVFMETARNPQGLAQAIEKAKKMGVPVVICKVGRTEESKKMAQSHTGALVGSETAYDALFENFGAIVVDTIDQMMNVALLCSQGRIPRAGGVAMVNDSGGLRELAMDCADKMDSPLAILDESLMEKLQAILPPPLVASNPLDCGGNLTGNYADAFRHSLDIFSTSDEVSMLGFEADFRDDYIYAPELLELATDLPNLTSKPCFIYSSFAQTNNKKLANALAKKNVPMLNGLHEVLYATSKFLQWGRKKDEKEVSPESFDFPSCMIEKWKKTLSNEIIDESLGLSLLQDFGLDTVENRVCTTWDQLNQSIVDFDFPVALKTASGIEHKSDQQGVYLDIENIEQLKLAYEDISQRLGERVIVQKMLDKRVELAFGCVLDADVGPIVMIAAGGFLIELVADRRFALAPVSYLKAEEMLESLRVKKLLDGVRGQEKVNKKAVIEAFVSFSLMCHHLRDYFKEIDVNPIIVNADSVVAADVLVLT